MLRRNNNLTTVTLSDATKLTAALPAVGTVVTKDNLEKGAVVLTDVGLRRLSAANFAALSDGDQVFVVQGKGSTKPLLKSPVLTKGNIKITIAKHKAKQEQITVIGYNGTTGSLPAANDTSFFIKIRKNDNDAANRSQPMSLFAQFKTDATGTQEELALGLVLNGTKNFAKEPANGYLKFEILCDEAGSAIGAAADTVVGTAGSTQVTVTDTGGDTSVNPIAVGDLFRVGTATTDEVYKVVASTVGTGGGVLTLDRALTQDVSLLGTTAEFIAAAASAAAEFGIRITGVSAPFDVDAFRDYYAHRFTATFSDESTLVTHVQGAFNGNGVWQQVAMDEYMTYGFEGQNEMLGVPPRLRDQEVKTPDTTAATGLKYSAINIAWVETMPGITSMDSGRGSHLIYLNLHTDGTLDGTANTGSELATALGLTPGDLNE